MDFGPQHNRTSYRQTTQLLIAMFLVSSGARSRATDESQHFSRIARSYMETSVCPSLAAECGVPPLVPGPYRPEPWTAVTTFHALPCGRSVSVVAHGRQELSAVLRQLVGVQGLLHSSAIGSQPVVTHGGFTLWSPRPLGWFLSQHWFLCDSGGLVSLRGPEYAFTSALSNVAPAIFRSKGLCGSAGTPLGLPRQPCCYGATYDLPPQSHLRSAGSTCWWIPGHASSGSGLQTPTPVHDYDVDNGGLT